METVLLKSTDAEVERELLRRTALGQPTSTFSWVPEHQKLYANLRIQWGAFPAHGYLQLTVVPDFGPMSEICAGVPTALVPVFA